MLQNKIVNAALSLVEQSVTFPEQPRVDQCDGCTDRNERDARFFDDDEVEEVVTVRELPTEWVDYLRNERGFDDDEIVEHAQTWYGYGCWPTRCLPLDAATILNGRLLKQHYIGSFYDYPAVEEFPNYFEGDGDEGANRVADCMNWCRKNCEGNWVISTREHVRQLWYVFVSFHDAEDEAAYLRDHR